MGRHARALQQTLHRRRHARSRRSLKIREYRKPASPPTAPRVTLLQGLPLHGLACRVTV